MQKKILLLAFTLLAFNASVWSQVERGKYVEFKMDTKKGENYRLVPLEGEGVLCMLLSTEFQKNNLRELIVTMLDTDLNARWKAVYMIENGSDIIGYHYTPGSVNLLLEKEMYKYQVLRIGLSNGASKMVDYEKVKHFYVSTFSTYGPILFFGGEIKGNPAVMRYDSRTGNSIVCPSINQLKADLVDMEFSKEHGILSVLLESQVRKDEISLYVNTYDLSGKLIYNYALPYSQKYNLLTYRPHILNQNEMLLIGTYALKNDDTAQGVYVLKLFKNQMQDLRFYDFGYLKNFFNYLPEKKRERLQSRIERRREKEKIYPLRYDMFLHDLKIQDDQLILAGDIYESDRSATSYPIGMMWYSGWRNTQARRIDNSGGLTTFSDYVPAAVTNEPPDRSDVTYGFDLVNSFACGIDLEGNLLWDNSYKFEDTDSDYPIEMTNVYANKHSVVFMRSEEKEMRYHVSPLLTYMDTVVNDTLNYLDADIEKVTDYDNGGIIDWYDNHYLSSGIRYINNKFNNELDRDVFYIYKITCDPRRRKFGE